MEIAEILSSLGGELAQIQSWLNRMECDRGLGSLAGAAG